MEAGNPKEEGNAITNRFSEGCTRWIPGDVGTREFRQEFVRIGTFVVGVGEDARNDEAVNHRGSRCGGVRGSRNIDTMFSAREAFPGKSFRVAERGKRGALRSVY
jgi:hypothetical protein